MKILETNNKLYLTMKEAVQCGMNEASLTTAKSKGTKCWDLINDPADKRYTLVGYEALSDYWKREVEMRFGNVYDHVARLPILGMVVQDYKANEFFKRYRYQSVVGGEAMMLKIDTVNKYTRVASWLGMLTTVEKAAVKKLGLSMAEFYIHVEDLLKIEKERGKMKGYAGLDVLPGDFGCAYRNLVTKMARFRNEGYECIIDAMYGNKNAAKIGRTAEVAGTNPVWRVGLTPALSEGEGGMPQGLLPAGEVVNEGVLPVLVQENGVTVWEKRPKKAE